jgi:hypothetical protein
MPPATDSLNGPKYNVLFFNSQLSQDPCILYPSDLRARVKNRSISSGSCVHRSERGGIGVWMKNMRRRRRVCNAISAMSALFKGVPAPASFAPRSTSFAKIISAIHGLMRGGLVIRRLVPVVHIDPGRHESSRAPSLAGSRTRTCWISSDGSPPFPSISSSILPAVMAHWELCEKLGWFTVLQSTLPQPRPRWRRTGAETSQRK